MNTPSASEVPAVQHDLWFAALRGDREGGFEKTLSQIDEAIKAGADPNAVDHSGKHLLDVMVSQGGLGLPFLIRHLCERGANPLLGNVLHDHAMWFSTAVMTLVDASVAGNYKDEEGADVLGGVHRWATSGMDHEWISDLITVATDAGATLDVLDNQGRSALHRLWSIQYGKFDMPEHHIASNQWMITNKFAQKGLIQNHLADPVLLGLIVASGYAPSPLHPEVGHFDVMDQVEALLSGKHLDASTPSIERSASRPRI